MVNENRPAGLADSPKVFPFLRIALHDGLSERESQEPGLVLLPDGNGNDASQLMELDLRQVQLVRL